jgi:hypothetical protein
MFGQKIIDSVKVYFFPVKEGIIYEYKPSSYWMHIEQGTSVITKYDSVFHFEEGNISVIRNYGDGYAVIIKNEKDEFICYSNLKSVSIHKGDFVKRNTYLGLAGISEDESQKQVDLIIFKKTKKLSFKREVEYIRCNISSAKQENYIL